VRAKAQVLHGAAQHGDGSRTQKILAALPFALTRDQGKALAEISADLESDKRMLRLLQGDVGSGKTVVALLAMAHVIEPDDSALMAPTEILARQHFATIRPLAEPRPDRRADDGRDKAAERRATLEGLAAARWTS